MVAGLCQLETTDYYRDVLSSPLSQLPGHCRRRRLQSFPESAMLPRASFRLAGCLMSMVVVLPPSLRRHRRGRRAVASARFGGIGGRVNYRHRAHRAIGSTHASALKSWLTDVATRYMTRC